MGLTDMNKRLWIVPVILLLASAGCNKGPANNSAPAQTASNATAPPAASTAPQTSSAPPQQPPPAYPPNPTAPVTPPAAPPPAAQPVAVTIPAGTHVRIRTIDPIDSATNTSGQVFRATLAAPIYSHHQVVIPAGAPVSLVLADVKSAGRIQGRSQLELRVTRIHYHDHSYPVVSSLYQEQGKSSGHDTAVKTGIGAAAGAIIGAIAGGGKGAAIGSAAGGGAGFGVSAATKGQQIRIPSESLLTFRLERPLTIQP